MVCGQVAILSGLITEREIVIAALESALPGAGDRRRVVRPDPDVEVRGADGKGFWSLRLRRGPYEDELDPSWSDAPYAEVDHPVQRPTPVGGRPARHRCAHAGQRFRGDPVGGIRRAP